MLNDQKLQLSKLPAQPTPESSEQLVGIISSYNVWLKKLPENTFKVLSRYIPDLNSQKIQIPGNCYSVSYGKLLTDYSQTLNNFSAFLDQRIQQIPEEIHTISSTQSRLQIVKLFDGMLRSYVSSIYWAEWKNTRESELQALSLKDNL
jgi:hypothetical protein